MGLFSPWSKWTADQRVEAFLLTPIILGLIAYQICRESEFHQVSPLNSYSFIPDLWHLGIGVGATQVLLCLTPPLRSPLISSLIALFKENKYLGVVLTIAAILFYAHLANQYEPVKAFIEDIPFIGKFLGKI